MSQKRSITIIENPMTVEFYESNRKQNYEEEEYETDFVIHDADVFLAENILYTDFDTVASTNCNRLGIVNNSGEYRIMEIQDNFDYDGIETVIEFASVEEFETYLRKGEYQNG